MARSAGGFDALSVALELEGTGTERGQAEAIVKAIPVGGGS